jgi:hypothetical protein
MRLYALEILVVNQLAVACLTGGADPVAFVAKLREGMIEVIRGLAFPEVADAAQSDLLSAELESAADRLMKMATGQILAVLEARQGRTP